MTLRDRAPWFRELPSGEFFALGVADLLEAMSTVLANGDELPGDVLRIVRVLAPHVLDHGADAATRPPTP